MSGPAEWLKSLKWDGIERLDAMHVDGMQVSGQHGYALREWMTDAIHRAIGPGYANARALVLGGPQGVGKSELLRCLAGEDWWFGLGAVGHLGKDVVVELQTKWIVELPEALLHGRWLRPILSANNDIVRLSYSLDHKTFPRGFVFAVTTNEISDDELNCARRRLLFLPVKKIDLAYFQANREQLWAETVAKV